jgi:hypothetical protein
MKRDWELLRTLLSQAESCPAGIPLILNNGFMNTFCF